MIDSTHGAREGWMPLWPLLLAVLLGLPGSATASASPSFLVDAEWLAAHLDDAGLVVLEVRYHPHRYFTVGHIPGAVQVQRFKDLGDNAANPLMRFPSKGAFQATLRRWGVNDDSTLDARPRDMYTGEVTRHSIQGGHIPRAVNVVSLDGTDAQSQKWLSDFPCEPLTATEQRP